GWLGGNDHDGRRPRRGRRSCAGTDGAFCWRRRESLVVTAGSGQRGDASANAGCRAGGSTPTARSTLRRFRAGASQAWLACVDGRCNVDVGYGQRPSPPLGRVDCGSSDGEAETVDPRTLGYASHHDHGAHPGGRSMAASPTSTIHSEPGAASETTADGVPARGSDFADLM